MSHFIEKCNVCDKVISTFCSLHLMPSTQCRCMKCEKEVRFSTCKDCGMKPPKQDIKTAIAEILFNSPHNLGWNNAKHLSDKILSLMSNHLELQAQSIINILGTECQECRAFMEGETASYKGYFPVVKIIDKLKESLK